MALFKQQIIANLMVSYNNYVIGFDHCQSHAVTEKIELKEVFDLFKQISSMWDSIGRALGVSQNFREGLRSEGVRSTKEHNLEQVLNEWIESECSEVSWRHLTEIQIELLELHNLAK